MRMIFDNTFSSDDVEERIVELQELDEDGLLSPMPDRFFGITDRKELAVLLAIREEFSGYADYEYGETIIADQHFRTYAQELAEDTGTYDPSASWPMDCIDWAAATEALQQDYAEVEVKVPGGYTFSFWMRAS